jgi:hypothetical protein
LQVRPAAQSEGSAQLVLHALVPSQANGVQSVMCAVHWPPPQLYVVSVDAAQVDGMHIVPVGYVAQAPAPSQAPVVPQVATAMLMQVPAGSVPPGGTAWHVPSWPATAHEWQGPQAAAGRLQQSPSVQWPLKHSVSIMQAAPFAFRLVQTLDMHVSPIAQSPLSAHIVLQETAPHA